MERIALFFLLPLLFFSVDVNSQSIDSVSNLRAEDSVVGQQFLLLDSNLLSEYSQLSKYKSFLSGENKTLVQDVQQYYPAEKKGYVFVVIVCLLLLVTYIKIAFARDVEELIQSFWSSNISHQIFRTQSREISFSSFLLNVNFVVAISLFVRFVLMKLFHVTSVDTFPGLLALIFLFTFFYVAKVFALKFIGMIFELKDECDEYIFNLFAIFKIVGLTLIPVVFLLYTASEKISVYIFITTFFVFVVFAALLVWRGLSTAYKLLYRSLYHFFIYVCVVEISPIFLLFKLLTKTIQ